ncbi:hypothetical protein KCU89_g5374, partial [Aureobasidium melanogenum]
MPKNRKPCPASTPDCPYLRHSGPVMEAPKTVPEVTAQLAPDQASKTLSEEEISTVAAASQRAKSQVISIWLPHTKKQIKEIELQIKQREVDILRTTELYHKLHEDIARWTLEKMTASATLKEMELLVEALVKASLKTEELD